MGFQYNPAGINLTCLFLKNSFDIQLHCAIVRCCHKKYCWQFYLVIGHQRSLLYKSLLAVASCHVCKIESAMFFVIDKERYKPS